MSEQAGSDPSPNAARGIPLTPGQVDRVLEWSTAAADSWGGIGDDEGWGAVDERIVEVLNGDRMTVLPSPADGIVTAAMLGDDEPHWYNPVRGYSEPTAWRPHIPPSPCPPGFAAMYVTFGTRYVREPHETGLPWPHPDGYLTVHYRDVDEVAGTYVAAFGGGNHPRPAAERARQSVMAYLGGHFATTYVEPPEDFVPWGELALLVLP